MIAGIKVLFVGKSWPLPEYQIEVCTHMPQLMLHIGKFRPDVIVTSDFIPGAMNVSAFELRKRWIHVNPSATPNEVSRAIESCYGFNMWTKHPGTSTNPLVSIYTGTYNTGNFLRDTYQSLREQTYQNWEWVVIDDESTDGTWERLIEIANEDFRVQPYRIKHSGKIGFVKDKATKLCRGIYLIELDHDDMLTDNAVDEVKKAFEADSEIGMVYTNCASFFQDGSPHMFNDDFWKSRYRDTEYRGKVYKECINPNIYDRFSRNYYHQYGWYLTVGPNHIRAYRADKLRELGGYNPDLPVADDWDVYARFFLKSKCYHLDKMLYLYRFLDRFSNTTFTRNKSIQDHLALGRNNYVKEFQEFNERRLASEAPEPITNKGFSVIIVDWNTKDKTLACVDSVRTNYKDAEIVLVQNGEPFDCPQANQIIPMEVNVGYSAGVNRGVAAATKPIVCLLNSDTIVEAGLFEKLIKPLDDRSVGITAPYSSYARPPQGNYTKENCPQQDRDIPLVFVCVMMRRDLFIEIGGLNPRLTTFEDDDFCMKVRRKGLATMVMAGAWIEHAGHQSFKANEVDVQAVMVENQKKFRKIWPPITVIALTKDEERALPGFFEQFRSITNNFAILDSGSTDKTLEWAKSNRIRIESNEFVRFDEQRNVAIEKFGPEDGWIIMLDPDERLDPHTIQTIPELVQSEEFDIYLTRLFAKHPDGSEKEWVGKPFLWRNKPEIRWALPVHEKLIGSQSQAWIKNGRIDHVIALHKPGRRAQAEGFYAKLANLPRQDVSEWPICDYNTPIHPNLKQINVGPTVSIVTPTYNRLDLLNEAVASALSQDYRPFEIVVVGDNCPVLPKAIKGVRVVLNLPNNHGAGGAVPRNYAINISSGEWIAYLDDDNKWEANHISSLMEAIEKNDAMFAISSMKTLGKERICDKPEFGKVDSSAVLHYKGLVYKYGWWKDRLEGGYCHDWEFVSRWVKKEKWAATMLPTLLYNAETSGQKDFLKKLVGA